MSRKECIVKENARCLKRAGVSGRRETVAGCDVNSRRRTELLRNCFGSITLVFLFSKSSWEGALLTVARRTAQFPVFSDNPDLHTVSLVEVNT